MDQHKPLSRRDTIILATGAATVFIAGIVQLIMPLAGVHDAWPTGIALALDGAFLPILSRLMWKYGFLARKWWGWPAITGAWEIWLVALAGWLKYEAF